MGTKENPAPNDCYDKALPDEPMFVLLARDPDAAEAVRYWITLRSARALKELKGFDLSRELAKLGEASHCSTEMDKWRGEHTTHVPAILRHLENTMQESPGK